MAVSTAIPQKLLKDSANIGRYSCLECNHLLTDPVQLAQCGHRLCRPCADELIKRGMPPKCPECKEDISDEDGAKYFPDRYIRREILSLIVICLFCEIGCNWEGKYELYHQHIDTCNFASSTCEYCGQRMRRDQIESHSRSCSCIPRECPLATLGCTKLTMNKDGLHDHMERAVSLHFGILAAQVLSIEERLNLKAVHLQHSSKELKLMKGGYHHDLEQDGQHSSGLDVVEVDGAGSCDHSGFGRSQRCMQPLPQRKTHFVARLHDTESPEHMRLRLNKDIQAALEAMLVERMAKVHDELKRNFTAELRAKDEELAGLRNAITKLEKTVRSKNAELEDRDFRISLIENGNHNGSMIWKIPQFSQRKADAQNGKYTSIFSLPFYSGRYGYKMCLRLYIMGDGIGKGTHLSLFFAVMRGEFDNILQWPFTYKVTFKLINQAGGRDIVDAFQPDPMSSSFRKPRSDMNIASGCPRLISHTELERGGFIVDDTIFIKCTVDTSSIRHP